MRENILNAATGFWTFLTLTECISWAVGIVGGITLIWQNIERALRARKERRSDP